MGLAFSYTFNSELLTASISKTSYTEMLVKHLHNYIEMTMCCVLCVPWASVHICIMYVVQCEQLTVDPCIL